MRITEPEIHICAYPDVDAARDHCFREIIHKEFGPTTRLIRSSTQGSIYQVALAGDRKPTEGVAAELGALESVAAAWVRPELQLTGRPADVIRKTSNDTHYRPPDKRDAFLERQLYLLPAAQGGIDAYAAWNLPGGFGKGIKVVDVEREWRFTHEDIHRPNTKFLLAGSPTDDVDDRNHGTSVFGILAARQNRVGTRGLCPEAEVRAVSIEGDGRTVAGSIQTAAEKLGPGDILLLEMMAPGPRAVFGPGDQRGWVPIERWPAELAAIQNVVRRGVIVVAAAGNGGEDLSSTVYDAPPDGYVPGWRNPFRDPAADSGAILVGAGSPPNGTHNKPFGPDGSRLWFSNYGERVDTQAWGLEVTTTGGLGTGFDELFPVDDEDRWYTDRFSGTSSAAAIVAGGLACVQGVLLAEGRPLLTPQRARALLREYGWEQQGSRECPVSQRIGPRMDLKELIDRARRSERRRYPPLPGPTRIGVTLSGGVVAFYLDPRVLEDAHPIGPELPQVKGPSLIVPAGGGRFYVLELNTEGRGVPIVDDATLLTDGTTLDPAMVDLTQVKGPSLIVPTRDQLLSLIPLDGVSAGGPAGAVDPRSVDLTQVKGPAYLFPVGDGRLLRIPVVQGLSVALLTQGRREGATALTAASVDLTQVKGPAYVVPTADGGHLMFGL